MENKYILLILGIIIILLLCSNTIKNENLEIVGKYPAQYTQCATEGMLCNNSGKNTVYYGADNKFIAKEMTGPFVCDAIHFGNPGSNKPNSCYTPIITPEVLPYGYVKCADDGKPCNKSGKNLIYYGAGDKYYSQQMNGPFNCSSSIFGDPNPGSIKACYYIPQKQTANLPDKKTSPLPPNYEPCAKEGDACNNNVNTPNNINGNVAYFGANGKFLSKSINGPFLCTMDTFGDPKSGANNACYIPSQPITATPSQFYAKCSDEYGMCNKNKGTNIIFYGTDGPDAKYNSRQMTDSFRCSNLIFGDPDPNNPQKSKSCYVPK